MADDWRHGGFGVYVHWPFCAAKCPYCDFNSHVRRSVDFQVWGDALSAALRQHAAKLPKRRVNSVFFGGGTPSLMPPQIVEQVIDTIAEIWDMPADAEISLEANPGSVEAARFAGYRGAGVNRVSLGVQALNDSDLRRLGRLHNTAEAIAAFEIARAEFDRVSFDLIYARQDQTLAQWETELRRALEMAVDHLSLYQLTIEPETRFGELAARGKLKGLPNVDLGADLYEMTQEICSDAGYSAYEVSNHARPGAECQHNLIYWRYGDYVGIGPGAHGRLTLNHQKIATAAIRSPEDWLTAIRAGEAGYESEDAISNTDAATELVMMGLRLSEGIDMERLTALAPDLINRDALSELVAMGAMSLGDRICVTEKGRPVLNRILKDILIQ